MGGRTGGEGFYLPHGRWRIATGNRLSGAANIVFRPGYEAESWKCCLICSKTVTGVCLQRGGAGACELFRYDDCVEEVAGWRRVRRVIFVAALVERFGAGSRLPSRYKRYGEFENFELVSAVLAGGSPVLEVRVRLKSG